MHSLRWASGERPAPCRMVWLPGAYQHAASFIDAGFTRAVAERGLAIDLEFVDLEMKHLQDRDALARLRTEILLPARRTGQVWLCGISLGGLLALSHARQFGEELDGLVLLAPYMGNRITLAEIEHAGLAHWQPAAASADDEERQAWRYLKERGTRGPPIHMGYGAQDRFVGAHRLLAAILPRSSVDTIEGGHDWPTWETLWQNFLNLQLR